LKGENKMEDSGVCCDICGKKKNVVSDHGGWLCPDCQKILIRFKYRLNPFKKFLTFVRWYVIEWGDIKDETEND
jgi:hypothetical protein